MRQLVLAGILLTAVTPTPSEAQDSWILWRKFEIQIEVDRSGKKVPISAPENPLWEPMDGFATVGACKSEATAELGRTAESVRTIEGILKENPGAEKMLRDLPHAQLGGAVLRDSVLIKHALDGGGTRLTELTVRCYPGSFDPRK